MQIQVELEIETKRTGLPPVENRVFQGTGPKGRRIQIWLMERELVACLENSKDENPFPPVVATVGFNALFKTIFQTLSDTVTTTPSPDPASPESPSQPLSP